MPPEIELRPRKHEHERDDALSLHAASSDDGAVTLYPSKSKLAIITFALCISVFLMALDNSIIATAIPRITNDFQSLEDVGWYGSAYLLTTAAFQLQFGKLYTFLSLKWTFLTAIGVFELGSLLCGAARNSTMLIIGRAIAGIGAAGIFSGAVLILANSVPLAKRPAYTYVHTPMLLDRPYFPPWLIVTAVCALNQQRHHRRHVWRLIHCGTLARRCLRRQGHLEMVLLHQPTHRGRGCGVHRRLLPRAKAPAQAVHVGAVASAS